MARLAAAAATAAGLALTWSMLPRHVPRSAPIQGQVAVHGPTNTGVFRTGVGERAVINLPDGSVATLDTDSEMRVAYSQNARAIYLVSGQALFEVAHGRPQPFQVFAKGQRITAVGTVFNVRIEGAAVRVSMVDGAVRLNEQVQPGAVAARRATDLILTAGEAALAAPDRAPVVETAPDVRDVTSWRGGGLVFNDTPLIDAIAEINRYTRRPIAIADPSVGAYRVSGVFKSNDPEHFAQAMTEVLPIELIRAADGAPMLKARKD